MALGVFVAFLVPRLNEIAALDGVVAWDLGAASIPELAPAPTAARPAVQQTDQVTAPLLLHTQEAQPYRAVTPVEDRPPERLATAELFPVFFTYIVVPGDTVSGVAAKFGLQPRSILENNDDIHNPDLLVVGQELTVPGRDGIVHTVRHGQSLGDIARYFDTSVEAILSYPGNHLSGPEDVKAGDVLLVVGGVQPPPLPPAPPAGQSQGVSPPPPAVPSDSGFAWPVAPCEPPSGTQLFGYARGRLHAGVDISLLCNPNAAIQASAGGTVTLADWNGGYGILVIIDHGNGYETYYAHLSSVAVSRGQQVGRGDVLGNAGCTGSCTGPHLHFEIRQGGQPIDPLSLLP